MTSGEQLDQLIDRCADLRYRARLFAAVNPLGFLVVTGVTLPVYLTKIAEMESAFRNLNATTTPTEMT